MGCVKSKGKTQITGSTADCRDVPRRVRIYDRMIENILLVWLDTKIDENQSSCQNTISQLRQVVNTIHTFTDVEQCIQFLEKTADEKVCLLVSASFAEQIVTCVHHLTQINSIFIFCDNRKYHGTWTQDWTDL